jgi:hypothetical protein
MDSGHRTCPCCPSTSEDRDHILRCPAAERNQWKHKLLSDLSSACTTHHTYEPLKKLLLDAVRKWLYPGQDLYDIPQCTEYANELHPLIRTQTRIGIQNAHLYRIRQHLPTKNNSGQKWQVAIITLIWERWYDLWKLRNADVHGKDDATQAIAEKEIARRLARIYDQRNHMEPSAQSLLHPDIQTHLEQPT